MAKKVRLKNPTTGVVTTGFYGFSWTSLFFGGIPAIIRGDIVVGMAILVASFFTVGLAGLIWAFVYNKRYTIALLEKGYVIEDVPEVAAEAKRKLGILDASA